MIPRANICTAASTSTAPRISDWMWPLRSPFRIQSSRNGDHAATARTPKRKREHHEHPQRLVQRVGAEDRERVSADVRGGRAEPGATRARWGSSRPGRPRSRPTSCPPGSGSRACTCSARPRSAGAPPRGCRRGSPRSCRARPCRTPGGRPSSRAAGAASWSARSARCSAPGDLRRPCPRGPPAIGSTRRGMSAELYWLSASVLTITSAPSLSAASRPAWKAVASPLLAGQADQVVDAVRAVRPRSCPSVEPSSTTSHSTSIEALHLARQLGEQAAGAIPPRSGTEPG